MIIVRYLFAGVAALWTVGVIIGFASELGKQTGTRGTTTIFAGIGVIAACCYFTAILFRNATRQARLRKSQNELTCDRDKLQ